MFLSLHILGKTALVAIGEIAAVYHTSAYIDPIKTEIQFRKGARIGVDETPDEIAAMIKEVRWAAGSA